jgi:hypothetical protein
VVLLSAAIRPGRSWRTFVSEPIRVLTGFNPCLSIIALSFPNSIP